MSAHDETTPGTVSARRDAILGVVLRAQATRRATRARRARAIAALAVVALGLATTIATFSMRHGGPAPSTTIADSTVAGTDTTPEPKASTATGPTIVRLAGDATALDRARIVGNGQTRRIDDETLLDLLERAGRPSGIIRVNGRATLTANTVADAQPAEGLGSG